MKIVPKYMNEFSKQLFKNALQTIKGLNTPTYKNDTKRCTDYLALKTKQLNPKVSWKIKRRYRPYSPFSRRCNLWLNEKLEILDD